MKFDRTIVLTGMGVCLVFYLLWMGYSKEAMGFSYLFFLNLTILKGYDIAIDYLNNSDAVNLLKQKLSADDLIFFDKKYEPTGVLVPLLIVVVCLVFSTYLLLYTNNLFDSFQDWFFLSQITAQGALEFIESSENKNEKELEDVKRLLEKRRKKAL